MIRRVARTLVLALVAGCVLAAAIGWLGRGTTWLFVWSFGWDSDSRAWRSID